MQWLVICGREVDVDRTVNWIGFRASMKAFGPTESSIKRLVPF